MAWCTTDAVRREIGNATLHDVEVTWTSPEDPFGVHCLAVLDTRAFETHQDLLDARRKRPACPALVLCAREDVLQLVRELVEAADDLALHDTPTTLLEYRLTRLMRGSTSRDLLTGLSQRSVLFESLQRSAEDPTRMPLSLLIVDLDHFKQVNDLHGHRVGDDVLTEAARRIARASPRGAVVARIGGDEFTVLHTMSSSEALAVADGIRAEFAAPMQFTLNLTVSIGCATVTVPGQSLFTPADEALYTAKARGRNSVVHYDEILRRARDENRDPALEGFENRTRVIAQRVAELISDRGRRIFGDLKKQADVDSLTGLFSRRYLDRRLPVELDVSSERDAPLTIALLDIDHFGNVNKTYGWPSGDKVLNEVAARVRTNIRSEDWAARYGGEEVCVVMHGTPLDVARPVLERVRTAVAEAPFLTTNGQKVEITVSGGAAERDGAESLETLMERVSQRLLLAKQGGRNRLVS